MRFRGSKGDQGRKGAVLVRTRTGVAGEEESRAVGVLVELFGMYNDGGLTGEAPLASYQREQGWRVWSRGRQPNA